MRDGKITELGAGQTHQPGFHSIEQRKRISPHSRTLDEEVWSVLHTGLPLCSASQTQQGEGCYSRNCCGLYRQTTTHSDKTGKEICKIARASDQQCGPYCAGRIFSKQGSCQKRTNKLRCHTCMIACGSKNSRRFTTCLFQSIAQLFQMNIPSMN